MLLPENFGGPDTDNMYAVIREQNDVIRTSERTHEFCLEHGTGMKEAMLMALFVEEMASNAIHYSSKKKSRPPLVDFRLYIKGNEICFSMMDLGNQFDPTMFYRLHHDDSPEKHYGIRMVMEMAKEVRYFSTFKSNNLVVNLNCGE